MQSVILEVNEICRRYLDNSMLCSLPSPGPPYNVISAYAIKNTRRRMEDRHVVINDLNTIFNKTDVSPSSYYAIFDGHGGHDAAAYSVAHLHQYLAESKFFAGQPENALTDAFCKTDLLFLEKCNVENFSGGTTALCALLRPKEKSLFLAWVGDSQALLSRQGMVEQCVYPHKPDRDDERKRIEAMGGSVVFWGTWRVNGQLAVSRAIGDKDYKPHITAEPDVREYALDGTEDFLVMACDGLWDVLREDETAHIVYQAVHENPDIVADTIAQRLARHAKEKGSTDNISVIVVFLREPAKIAAEPLPHIRFVGGERMEAGFDSSSASSNPFALSHAADMDDILASHQKDGFLLDLDGFRPAKAVPSAEGFFMPTNGKDQFEADLDDLGPETDVDAVDDVHSLVKMAAADGGMSEELEEKVAKEIDANLLKSVVDHCNDSNLEHDEDDEQDETVAGGERKREVVTPPADEVHDAGLDSDSEDDGWNYIKGDEDDDKENLPPGERGEPPIQVPQAEIPLPVDTNEEIDNMSQLNPNAEEFVPVSPTRADNRADWMALKDDHILAQSPRRPSAQCDFNVPDESDFAKDVKNRPSDVYSNGHENGHKQSSLEIMENLLNGKNIEDIEFQPTGSPSKAPASTVAAPTEQFIFGPNAAAFSTPTKFMDQSRSSTKANYGDESELDESDLLDRLNKEKDPMSMSFYQEKDDDETPFDVDKEEKNTEEKEQEEVVAKSFDDSISDLPEHQVFENCETTDLDHKEDGICELPQSPHLLEPAHVDTLSDLSPQSPVHLGAEEAIVVIANTSSPLLDLDNVSDAEVAHTEDVERKFVTDDEIIERPLEPLVEVGAKSPIPPAISEEVEDFAPHAADEVAAEPVAHPEPVVCYASREAELFQQEAASEDISEASDAQHHEFIPETTLEIAQSPEPVVIDNTPDFVVAPTIPEGGVHKPTEEEHILEADTCLSPAPAQDACLSPTLVQETCVSPITPAQETCLSPIPTQEACLSPEPVHEMKEHIENVQTPREEEVHELIHDVVEHKEMLEPVQDVQSTQEVLNVLQEVVELKEEIAAPVQEELMQEIVEPEREIIEPEPAVVETAPEVAPLQELIETTLQEVLESTQEDFETTQDILGTAMDIEDKPLNQEILKEAIKESQLEQELSFPVQENPVNVESSPIADSAIEFEGSPLPEMTTSEVVEVITPVDDITSSVKDESPMEEIKEIPQEPVLEVSELPAPSVEAASPLVEDLPTIVATEQKEESGDKAVTPDVVTGVAATAVAAAVTTVVVGAGVIAADAETKKTTAKPRTSTSAVKKSAAPAATKTSTKPLASTTKTTTSKTTAPKPAVATTKAAAARTSIAKAPPAATTAAKAPPKPRAPLTAAAKPTTDKKSLTNGDTKAPAAKIPPIRRPASGAATKTSAPKPTPPATTRPSSGTTTKPSATTKSSVTTATKTAAKPAPATTAATKPRPTTLSARPTNTTKTTTSKPLSSSTTTTTTVKATTMKTTTSSLAPAKPKAASTVAAKPRVPLSARPASARGPDAEKQNKENVNKLTASRTAATRTASTRKPADATKTATATKPSTVHKAPPIKRPMAKNAANSAVSKTIKDKEIVPNGLSGEKEKETSLIEAADQMIKDLSPINNLILDNSQIAEATAD